jgi:ATP-dependent exoDNAse (exonuclease V) alpha subunit
LATQEDAIEAIEDGENVCLTGKAGTGKSHVIKQTSNNRTLLAAPTGISALNIGAETAHSLFNIPIGIITDEEKKKHAPKCQEIFGGNDIIERIVLDEVSMVRADGLDWIDLKLREVKQVDLPFGGIQMVVVGDFFQLPPIVSPKEKPHFKKQYLSPWAFNSKVWKQADFQLLNLDKVFRQNNADQIDALNKIREQLDGWEEAVDQINIWGESPNEHNSVILCNFTKDADAVNAEEYRKEQGEERLYRAIKSGKFRKDDVLVDQELYLKLGCRVIVCANSPGSHAHDYRNGMTGTVVEFGEECVYVELDGGDTVPVIVNKWEKFGYSNGVNGLTKGVEGTFSQIPLKLGYAISVHKSQGMTLDNISIDFGDRCFTDAQAYVALSRAKDLRNVHLVRPLRTDDILVASKVKRFIKKASQTLS